MYRFVDFTMSMQCRKKTTMTARISLRQQSLFAQIHISSVVLHEMTPSPFHGIFSNFGSDASAPAVTPLNIATEEEASIPVSSAGESQTGQIAVDIYELENYYIIRAPIAGVKLSDIDIEVDEKVLTISGTRNPNDDIESDQYYLQECFWGDFQRSITLPISIDPKKVKATFSKDSILKVLIPKEEKVKIVRISEG